MVLLNSAMRFIPIFFISFIKMHVSVWRKLVGMQIHIIGGGSKSGDKVACIKWENV